MKLDGNWSFALDAHDRGIDECWYAGTLADPITLPGSLQAQGYGDPVSVATPWVGGIVDRSWYTAERYAPYREPGNVKVPFWLQPDHYYAGAAWYQREVEIPAAWAGRRVLLWLERPHWETQVWLDTQAFGRCDSLSTPHIYDLGIAVAPGRHRLTIRVDNRMIVNVGPNAHSVSDHTQSNWNGVVGRIELIDSSPIWIDDAQIFVDTAGHSARVRLQIGNSIGRHGLASITITPRRPDQLGAAGSTEVRLTAGTTTAEFHWEYAADAALWDEFNPVLHDIDISLDALAGGLRYHDQRSMRFGLREVGVHGSQISVNGRPIFLRGTLECASFPHTGYPPTDVASWQRIMRIAQAHGLNHLRFHSWCPPEAAFDAADELGVYLQVECASWANIGATVGDGDPLDTWLYHEAERIIRAYGNHPSFLLMAYGNEPGGARHTEYLTGWVRYWREHEPRRLRTAGAGCPAIPENDYHNIPEPRVQRWGEELKSRINDRAPETETDYTDYVERMVRPIVSHEIGQWCVFPNFAEIEKYTGVLKARNFEIFRDSLAANHMADQAHDFLIASGKLQTLCYKEDIESALRTRGFAGFQLLDLHDFPGQGTALVGVLDPFWDEKGYVTPAEFRRFCAPTVPLARMARRYWYTGDTFTATIDIAHYGAQDLVGGAHWQLIDATGVVAAEGSLPSLPIATGGVSRLGTISYPLVELVPARRYTLWVTLEHGAGSNSWDLWLFADQLDTSVPDEIVLATTLDADTQAVLHAGGRVLLLPDPAALKIESELGFSSVFWNTAWTKRDTGTGKGQAPHTLGLVCDPAHPALAGFPTESHSNWQWWDIIHGAQALLLDHLPPTVRPIVQPIDTWFDNHRLGLLLEARVGGGRLMICSADLQNNLDQRPVARQLRWSLLQYMASEAFAPAHELTVADLHQFWRS
ncbi:MAG TPA: glycoside hydrolase family 2 TIM barrel-domain containing protein [Roseiflexaceae bacterium]|nr:glycoside hydrolase family 2 TIM barrel-domain containing protein [Roseiflexaceae bacterium]